MEGKKKVPNWNTVKEANQAKTVMYTNITIGHFHELVSRRTTANVLMHWQANAKKTINDNAVHKP